MIWYDTDPAKGLAASDELRIHVDAEHQRGLVVRSSRTRRMSLSIDDRSMLWVRIGSNCSGVSVLRCDTLESPAIVPPIRSAEARDHRTVDAWMRFFARALGESGRSPLSVGTWKLTELRPCPGADTFAPVACEGLPSEVLGLVSAPTLPRAHYEEWRVEAPCRVIPLRGFGEPDVARVKAWRKHARDGTLPPILLWFVRGLEMMVLLDGHDRLCAAIAERTVPQAIVLWQSSEEAVRANPGRESVARAYEQSFDHAGDLERRSLSRALVSAHRSTWTHAITTARAARFDAEWNTEVVEELEREGSDEVRETIVGLIAGGGVMRRQ